MKEFQALKILVKLAGLDRLLKEQQIILEESIIAIQTVNLQGA